MDSTILQVVAPAVANLLLFPLVGAVDLFWVGRMGDPLAIAGMGAANQVFTSIYFIISFLPTVVTPLVAAEFAKGRKEEAANCIREAFFFAFVLGCVGCAALVCFPARVLSIITSEPQILRAAVPYLRLRGISLIPALWSTIAFATFRGLLDTRTPLKISTIAQGINMLLDPVLMFGLGLGVAGAALATSIAELFSCGCFVLLLWRKGYLNFNLKAISWIRLKSLLQSGFVVQLRSLAMNVAFIAITRRVTEVDPTGILAAAHQVTMQFWSIGGYVLLGLSTAAAGLVPNCLGRSGVDAARSASDRLLFWGVVLGAILGTLQVLAVPLIRVFSPVEAVCQAALLPSILAGLSQIMQGPVFAGEGTLQGMQAYRWMAGFCILGCVAMMGCLAVPVPPDKVLLTVWIGLCVFNSFRLAGSLSYRFLFGPLARRNSQTA